METRPERKPLPAPTWINDPPDKWPPAARAAMDLMATAAERRLAAEKAKREQEQPAPGAA